MLHLQKISKQYGSKVLFENADANLGDRSRVALIGPNGAGKSTLIKLILGQEFADSGSISKAKHLSIGHLAQEVPKFSGRTVLGEVTSLGGRRDELNHAKTSLEKDLETSSQDDPEILTRYGRILEELEMLDEYRLEARAKEILSGMGFKPEHFDRNVNEFSGGWLMRIALSRVLLSQPDLLLLDEPTNHLDLETVLWLEEFLESYSGAMLLVSHDTGFLNRMVKEVWEIDQRKLFTYRGNLEAYSAQKQERLEVLRSQYEGQQAKLAELQSFIDRFGAKATKARQAQSRQKQIDKMELIELPDDKASVRFRFPPAPHSGKEVLTAKAANFAYGPKVIFKNLNWVIQRGSRVAIVGVNGAGKTTLLKLLAAQMQITSGDLKWGHEVKIGYYAQHQAESLNFNKTIIQELEMTAPEMQISRVRAIAGAFLFSGDAVEKRCGVLSGGEKARVALAKLLLSPSNFLLLDEPTNHLDVQSRGVLFDALEDYTGTLCLVSHDREFVAPLVDTVLEITQDGQVHNLVGGYEEYLTRKIHEASQRARDLRPQKSLGKNQNTTQAATSGQTTPSQAPSQPSESKTQGPSNNQKQAWSKELQKLEKEIEKLESSRASLHDRLGDTATYNDPAQVKLLVEEQSKVESSLNQKMSRWEELSGLLEFYKS